MKLLANIKRLVIYGGIPTDLFASDRRQEADDGHLDKILVTQKLLQSLSVPNICQKTKALKKPLTVFLIWEQGKVFQSGIFSFREYS